MTQLFVWCYRCRRTFTARGLRLKSFFLIHTHSALIAFVRLFCQPLLSLCAFCRPHSSPTHLCLCLFSSSLRVSLLVFLACVSSGLSCVCFFSNSLMRLSLVAFMFRKPHTYVFACLYLCVCICVSVFMFLYLCVCISGMFFVWILFFVKKPHMLQANTYTTYIQM